MDTLKEVFAARPWWMNLMMVFCAYMTFIYMPFDFLFKPVEQDEEVWFGYMLHGWTAKATEPLHWAIYGFGFYGFLKMKSWMHPWAAVYVFQIAIAMVVWFFLYGDGVIFSGFGTLAGGGAGLAFTGLGVMLLRAKPLFQSGAQTLDQGA